MEFIKSVLDLYLERKDFFLKLIGEHLFLSLIAIVISTIIGISLGILISEKKKLAMPVKGITSFLYTIPSIAILGFLVSISGVGNITAIITLSIYGLLPMITNTYTGILNIDKDIIEAGKGMGATNIQLLYKIKIPLAAPVIFAGFRNMVVMTIALCGIASFIGAGGLGVAIWRGITTNSKEMTLAGSLLIAIIALLIDLILSRLEKKINNMAKGYKKSVNEKENKEFNFKTKVVISTTIIVVIFSMLFGYFSENKKIVVASKPMTEQYILTEIIAQLIENKTDIEVDIKKGIGGGTANIHPALVSGEIDLYPEYTGTSWEYVLKKDSIKEKNELIKELKEEYKNRFKLNWLNLYGYNSTYAIVMNKDIAEKYEIETYSDLAKVSENLIFGAEYDFYERDDGYDAISQLYGFKFKNSLDLDMGLKYKAIEDGKVDVITASTTDGRLVDERFKVLKDDKKFFPDYFAGTIIRQETLDEYPELEDVLNLLEKNISEKEIISMNYDVEINKKDDFQVAKEFLLKKGLIK